MSGQLFLFLPPLLLTLSSLVFLHSRPLRVNIRYCVSLTRPCSVPLSAVDMVDTQQLLAWPVGFSLTAVDLPELDDSPHCVHTKHMTTLDYSSISSSVAVPPSMSPQFVSPISSVGLTYDPSPPPSDEHLTIMDYTHMHSYRTEPNMHSEY